MGMAEKSRRLVEDGDAWGAGWAQRAVPPCQVPATSVTYRRSGARRAHGARTST